MLTGDTKRLYRNRDGFKLIAHCSFKRSGYQVRDASNYFVAAGRVD